MSRTDLRKRVAALNKAINPAGLLTAKLAKLTKEQQDEHRRWQDRCGRHYAAINASGANAYDRAINHGDHPPMLRRDVWHALFGPDIDLPATATASDAMDAFHDLLAKGR